MDGFLGYNQIKMYPDDERHIFSSTVRGVLLHGDAFGLKNVGTTYQHAMSIIFHDHLRKMMECYVDDIAVKSYNKSNHLDDLIMVFNIMQAHQLKMNPTKSFLGVPSGKFLGFVITSKEIHLDPDKIKAIQEM